MRAKTILSLFKYFATLGFSTRPTTRGLCWLAILLSTARGLVAVVTTSSPIVISTNDRLIWATNVSADTVSVLRPDINSVLATIPVGDEPQSIALTPDGQYAYVANAASNNVTVIRINDPAWGTFSAQVDMTAGVNGHITTGAEPWNIVCSPDGNRVFVANSQQDTVTVINTATRGVIGHVHLRPDPFARDD
ncbi:MAG: YncE family protein [Verrucomicrobiales bacterium]